MRSFFGLQISADMGKINAADNATKLRSDFSRPPTTPSRENSLSGQSQRLFASSNHLLSTVSKMAALAKAINAKIRSNPMLSYVCTTRTCQPLREFLLSFFYRSLKKGAWVRGSEGGSCLLAINRAQNASCSTSSACVILKERALLLSTQAILNMLVPGEAIS